MFFEQQIFLSNLFERRPTTKLNIHSGHGYLHKFSQISIHSGCLSSGFFVASITDAPSGRGFRRYETGPPEENFLKTDNKMYPLKFGPPYPEFLENILYPPPVFLTLVHLWAETIFGDLSKNFCFVMKLKRIPKFKLFFFLITLSRNYN